LINAQRPIVGHSIRDGMAQASSFKSSIRYQVCNSAGDNDISRYSPIKTNQQSFSPVKNDDLCEITISPSSPNHHSSSLTHLIPTISTFGQTSSSTESTNLIKSIQPLSSLPKYSLGSTLSISSNPKPTNTPPHRQSLSRQSIFGTLATTFTAVRKSSTTAFALAQQRLSTDNGNLFSGYQGKIPHPCTIVTHHASRLTSILRDHGTNK
jgi:hypothetical protein